MNVWQKGMNKIQTPENIPRLFDMVKVKDEHIRPAFYFALRDTLVAENLDQATKVAFQRDKRWRVVTLQGQIIEQSGKCFMAFACVRLSLCVSNLISAIAG